ncbi:KPN_02809 family neutral zinc metallopeptidase [Variovorax arabinosiphilus]|jgi:predicted metalloprotease|uniref:KPN_02809 family neutral zinc metallopeptidase n=1 Tax=Variovorax arabinosiphilus TaxID=3053498 RepID=UPI0025788D18|nr:MULTISPECIES: neutral zinc metallopeptidase [unclassified Variovorax]MDM0120295.1 neutral zinc metallopeptidase [Variovorax sp. J2L1-78]MDM0127793.1 neutral zinc metallopeptidase [Variovorax sp. J2L1-63]MDM0231492.1 neutral zinc metallopeptidase [Variovorax sp. J2R1-6]
MRWEGNEQSDNVEDRRSDGGGGGGFPIGGRSVGIGTVAVALIAGWIFGINPLTVLGLLSGGGAPQVQQQQGPAHKPPPDDREAAFVSTVLKNTEVVWTQAFQQNGGTYQPPRLVLFRGATPTACGTGQSAMGPFYCPGDKKVYIDLGFFDTLKRDLGAPGEFAQAYVIAHEVGHHVQDELGITAKVDGMRGRLSPTQNNAVSVRVELQADCFAGVWAHHSQQSKQWLDPGDIEAAMNAAQKIGDDALQRSAGRAVVPDSFTHGTSAQRQRWFGNGYKTGSMQACDTFAAKQL